MSISTSLSRWQNTVLCFFLAGLVTLPWGYAIGGVAGLGLVTAALIVTQPRGRKLHVDRETTLWFVMLLLLGLHGILDAWRSGMPVGHNTTPSMPWWPWLAALILIGWRLRPPSAGWWSGILLGAIGAGGIASYERLVEDASRASNGINAIPFGDLSMLLGVLAIVWVLSRWRDWPLRGALAIGVLAALAGGLASLLSGTRGSWVVVPVALFIIYKVYGNWLLHGWQHLSMVSKAGLTCVVLLVLVWAAFLIQPRLADTFSDIQRYRHANVMGTSLGLRIDLWRNGVSLFLAKPILGWGEGGMMPVMNKLIAQGQLNEQAQYFGYQLHNDWIDAAARRGLLGVLMLGGLYGLPLYSFFRRLRNDNRECRTLALAGVLVVVMYLGFGMSQTMFRDERTYAGYLGLTVACWTLLKRAEYSTGMA